MIKFINDKLHLLILPNKMTKERFLKNAKVKENTYMSNFLGRIYDALTVCNVNLKSEYEKYYSEYDTFEDFLFRKYPMLTSDELKCILAKLEAGYVLHKVSSRSSVEYNSFLLFEEEDFENKILKLLECDENKNRLCD